MGKSVKPTIGYEKLLSGVQLAKQLGISPQTLSNWKTRHHDFDGAFLIAGKYLYDPALVIAWFETRDARHAAANEIKWERWRSEGRTRRAKKDKIRRRAVLRRRRARMAEYAKGAPERDRIRRKRQDRWDAAREAIAKTIASAVFPTIDPPDTDGRSLYM